MFNPIPKSKQLYSKRIKPRRGLKTKFSTKVRKQIIERDNSLCVRCGVPYHNIHHITFASSGGEGVKENGVCVCIRCHSWAHSGKEGRRWFELYREERLIGNLLNLLEETSHVPK